MEKAPSSRLQVQRSPKLQRQGLWRSLSPLRLEFGIWNFFGFLDFEFRNFPDACPRLRCRPELPAPGCGLPATFRGEPTATTQTPFADLDWWDVYQDATLPSLHPEALTNNYDLRIAATRVEQARAVAMQARSQLSPASLQRHRQPRSPMNCSAI